MGGEVVVRVGRVDVESLVAAGHGKWFVREVRRVKGGGVGGSCEAAEMS